MKLCHFRTTTVSLIAAAAGLSGVGRADTVLPLDRLRLVARNGVKAKAGIVPTTEEDGHTLRVTFEKMDDVRRMITIGGAAPANTEGGRVLVVDGELHLTEGRLPRLCAVLFGREGQRWIRKGSEVQPGVGQRSWPVSLARMQAAAFAETDTGAVAWPMVERVWIGLVFDGPARGRWDVQAVRLTNDPPPALAPAVLTHGGSTGWNLHHDTAVKAELTTSEARPDGEPGMRVAYTFPGGRHMYCTCSLPVSAEQPELYRAVRLTYRASLPPGITGLLFGLAEGGGTLYLADPMPEPSAEWRTVTIRYDALKRASWTQDPNGRFDPETLITVWVGTHGAATGEGGPGRIDVAAIELVP